MAIKSWPVLERPREKLLARGAKHLTDAELLAIFINTGTRDKTALDIARNLLIKFGSLKKVLQSNLVDICQCQGLGKAKYALIHAGIELGRRYLHGDVQNGEVLNDTQLTQHFLLSRLSDYQHEVFSCLFLDNANRLICFEELFQGTLNEASVYPREIVKRALLHNAAKIIFAHNHPSGDPMPSLADRELTKILKEALQLVEIQVIDHIVVGKQDAVSFAEWGWI